MVEWGLSENLANLCRLCLQVDDFIVDIFHRLDPNPQKKPLPERIYDLYQVKVSKCDGLPTNICHRCLYFTESFTEFRDNVRKCEARLQSYVASLGILGSVRVQLTSPKNGIKTEELDCIEDFSDILPENNSLVTIVDPNQEYESSDEDFSIDSDNEYEIHVPQAAEEDKKEETNFTYANTDSNENSDALKNVFLCQYCDMAFTGQIECAEHEARHDAANPHSCNFCPFRCASRQTVISHIKELHDNERPYVCVQCNKGFGRRSDLKKHTIVHTGIRPFTCPVCNKNFSRNTNLTKHLRIHTGLKPHVCQKCPRSFTTPADLLRHQRIHNDYKTFQCKKCPSTFARKNKLIHHEKIHVRKEKSNSNNINAVVEKQPSSHHTAGFDTESMVIALDPFTDMNQAENIDHGHENRTINNKFIKPLFATQPAVPLVEEVPGIISTFSAPFPATHLADDQSYDLSEIKSNNKSIGRAHICPVCSKSFLRKRELQRHSVIHTGIKPFACKICSKRFNRKDKVVRHERIHMEEKYSCTKCNLEFSKQEALDMHLKVHELEKTSLSEQSSFQSIVLEPLSFQRSLEEGFRPQLNFYSEIKSEFTGE